MKLFSLAEIILHCHDGDLSAARAAYDRAADMLRPGHEGPITALLRRKGHIESAGATAEARAFLKTIARSLK